MYLKLTKHYKGSFPVDAGGVTFAGFGQKEVSDAFGKLCVDANFPYVVPCTNEGVPLVDVPPVKEEVAPVAEAASEIATAKVEEVQVSEDGQTVDIQQPAIEVVDDKAAKKKKK